MGGCQVGRSSCARTCFRWGGPGATPASGPILPLSRGSCHYAQSSVRVRVLLTTPPPCAHCTMKACWVEPFGPLGAYAWGPQTNTNEGHQRPPSHTCSYVSSLSPVRMGTALPDGLMGSPAGFLGGALWVRIAFGSVGGCCIPAPGRIMYTTYITCELGARRAARIPHPTPQAPKPPHTHVLCSHLWAGRLENGPRTKD